MRNTTSNDKCKKLASVWPKNSFFVGRTAEVEKKRSCVFEKNIETSASSKEDQSREKDGDN